MYYSNYNTHQMWKFFCYLLDVCDRETGDGNVIKYSMLAKSQVIQLVMEDIYLEVVLHSLLSFVNHSINVHV